jgi:hypothetical protein
MRSEVAEKRGRSYPSQRGLFKQRPRHLTPSTASKRRTRGHFRSGRAGANAGRKNCLVF